MAERAGNPGPAVDILGQPVVDPTENVRELVEAAVLRLDDLRELEARHFRELLNLRAEHFKELRDAEAGRLDAIRAVDVQAVQQRAQEAETRAAALAQQVSASAEAMRTQVAAAASAAATSLGSSLAPIQEAIADLRRSQYETAGGRTQVVESREKGGQMGLWIGLAIAAGGLFLSVAGIVITLVVVLAA